MSKGLSVLWVFKVNRGQQSISQDKGAVKHGK